MAEQKFNDELLKFFKGDELAAFIWEDKYMLGDEKSPLDMFKRHAKEIADTEHKRLTSILANNEDTHGKIKLLSDYGYKRYGNLLSEWSDDEMHEDLREFFEKLCNFDNICLGGSMQQGIGNHEFFSSLSNCFVLGQPWDSYSGINKKADEGTQLMKRRGGIGIDLSSIRPFGAPVHNQSGWSSGPVLFADRYSDITKEVAQYGRRGALMLSMHVNHPNSIDFARRKQDLTKLTGANISINFSDEFMRAVDNDTEYIQSFPCDWRPTDVDLEGFTLELNKLVRIGDKHFVQRINAKEYWTEISLMAWTTAEPGLLFEGNWYRGGTDGCYPQYKPVTTNPCSEIPMQPYDACRLVAGNIYNLIDNPFTPKAKLNTNRAYRLFYEQMTTGDILVDLEFEYIDRIIGKINFDDDPQDLKDSEIGLWNKIKETAQKGRRCGCGFTGLGDMLASLGLAYYSPKVIENLFQLKLEAELDATTDMAILYGAFDGFSSVIENNATDIDFFNIIKQFYPEKWNKMMKYGRRNVSWSTAAPNGTGGIMCQVTSGIEPMFLPYYKRRKKCISDNERVDHIDPSDGQKFTEYMVMHPKFIEWFQITGDPRMQYGGAKQLLENSTEDEIRRVYEKSPWFGSIANDLNWHQRVEIQSIVQKYTTHAISSTINLPKDCEKDLIGKIYMQSWKVGLKGNTVYRDGSRAGILTSNEQNIVKESDSLVFKRPKRIPAHYHTIKYKNKTYSVIIGFDTRVFDLKIGFTKPYEIFIVSEVPNLPENLDDMSDKIIGELVKEDKNWYNFESETFILKEVSDCEHDEKMISIMLSGLFRNNTPLPSAIKILEKTKPIAGTFTHRLIKILTKYVSNGEESGDLCPNCGTKLRYENGCSICLTCGNTKC